MKIYIGIDPGINGAIAILREDGLLVYQVMPKIGKLFDAAEFSALLESFTPDQVTVVIEDVHAIFGASAKSTFNFGYICGMIEGLVQSRGLPYTKIQPKAWQKLMYVGIPEHRKPPIKITTGKRAGQTMKGKLDTKAMSLIAAKRLFPNRSFCKTSRCTKAHDGIVDAVLLAEYGRRML